MFKNLFLMILCALPLLANAQMNDVRKMNIPKKQSLLQQMDFARMGGKHQIRMHLPKAKQMKMPQIDKARKFLEIMQNKTSGLRAAASEPIGRIDSVITKYISYEEDDDKTVYQYDANNNITLALFYSWDSDTNTWELWGKHEAQYDANKNITMVETHDYVYGGGDAKREYQYDSNNNITWIKSYYGWDIITNTWQGYYTSKFENQYDTNNNLILTTEYEWDSDTQTWTLSFKSEYQYDASNNRTVEIFSFWNSDTNTWVEYDKYVTQYDSNNNQTVRIYYSRNNNTWIEQWNAEYHYDTNNYLTSEIDYNWDSDTNAWVVHSKDEFQFDFASNNNYYLEIYSYWDSDANTWVIEQESRWYYTLFNGIVPVSEEKATVYPNPVSDSFRIEGIAENALLTIIDINGKTVMQQTVHSNEPVWVGDLKKGIYIVKVKDNAVKMIKQ